MSKTEFLGYQITASFEGCALEKISNPEELLHLLQQITEMLGYDEVAHFTHSFTPFGITCVLILAQSHLIAHTWPEFNALVIDLFVCGGGDFTNVFEVVKETVLSKSVSIETRLRQIEIV